MGIDSPFDSSSVPPKKRLKTADPDSEGGSNQYDLAEIPDGEESDSRRKQPESTEDSEPLICGICLSENGNAIRGQVDSCDHFFCFVCIMEWAKVESRCPMCKRRFSTIRRPPKQGVFSSERLVNVVQCDQVYHPSGNTSIGTFDPYAQIQCGVCHSSSDESLLLLCDLCDSASHTFCVALGSTVPEGDWFCHDCVLSKTEHEKTQKDEEDINQNLSRKSNVVKAAESDIVITNQNIPDDSNVNPEPQAAVSIFDIVCNSDESPLACIRARSASVLHERTQTRHGKTPVSKSEKITQNGARTLTRCRNVRNYVQAIRDNWNSLQNGSLRFSSTSTASSSSSFRNGNSSSSANGKKGTKNDSLDEISAHIRRSCDVDKAWKMMDKAKSVKQANGVRSVLKNPTNKASDGSSSPDFSRRQIANRESRNSCITENQYKQCSTRKETDEHLSSKWRTQKPQILNMSKPLSTSKDNQPNSLAGLTVPKSESEPRKVQASRPTNACRDNWDPLALKNLHSSCSSQNVSDMKDRSFGSVTPVMSVSEASESLKMKANAPKEVSGSKAGKYEDAKSEILLLVKLNLKLLNGQKQLEKDGFKEVARVSTHTILAACGLGQSRYVFQTVPSCVCTHSDGIHKSTLMPNSCRECFYVFVKNVVNSVLSDKLSKPSATSR